MGAQVIVAVTAKEYHKAKDVFERAAAIKCVPAPAAEVELAAAIHDRGARHAIVGAGRYSGPLYESLSKGAVIARFGVGHDGIDKGRATSAGLLCTNTPGVLDQSVAECAILLLLAAARNFAESARLARTDHWDAPAGHELSGKKLAVIGLGPIGRAVARSAAFGLGMGVTGVVRTPVGSVEGCARITIDFADGVRDADFVSLHIPATPANTRFLNAERLSMIAERAWVINTARGSVLDEHALYNALADGRIAGAALDVFEHEPYVPAHPARDLRALPNVVMLPHIGSNTVEANRRMANRALLNIALAEAGRWNEMDLLNPEVLDRLRE